MSLTAAQVEEAVRHLGNGARISEAARMVRAPRSAFDADWTTGRRDAEAGRDTPERDFYEAADEARARHCATKRAEAAATAGSRESTDLLRYVESLEAEVEPMADDQERANAVRLCDHADPLVRAAAAEALAANRELLRVLTASTRDAGAAFSTGGSSRDGVAAV